MAKSILVVVPRVPWPARRSGFSVRYFPLLKYLGERHSVDLIVLGDQQAWGGIGPLPASSKLAYVDVSGRDPGLAARVSTVTRGLLPGNAPLFMRSVWTPKIVSAVSQAAGQRNYDVMLWSGPEYPEAALSLAKLRPAPRCVFDLVDSPSLIGTRARSQPCTDQQLNAIRRWENELRDRADLTIYICDADAQASRPGSAATTLTLPNGIYLDDLPEKNQQLPLPPGMPSRYVLFFGHMSFEPNVDAACWLAAQIMPAVRAAHGDIKLVIAGHQPAPAVQALAGPDTVVTGSVDSIWPYVNNASACVFPLRLGSGLQNKILEALVLGKPVVTTRHCAASIGAKPEVHLLAGDSLQEITNASLRVLNDPDVALRLGAAGAELVRREFDWSVLTERFERAIFAMPVKI